MIVRKGHVASLLLAGSMFAFAGGQAVFAPASHDLGHPKQPCASLLYEPNGKHVCSVRAYHDVMSALHSMTPWCVEQGQGTSAWAERNDQQPHGYEVLARCEGGS